MQTQDLVSLFELREIEAQALEKLIFAGQIGATDLARQVNVSRTSIYDVLERLVEKGLVGQGLSGGAKQYSLESPAKLTRLIEDKKAKPKGAQKVLSEIAAIRSANTKFAPPRLQLFHGRPALQQMMNDMLLYPDTHVLSLWPIADVVELLTKDFFANFHKQRLVERISVDMIWPDDKRVIKNMYQHLAKEYFQDIKVRVAPPGFKFTLGYTVYSNTVRFISSSKESFGFLIESAELKQTMASQFAVVWQASKALS